MNTQVIDHKFLLPSTFKTVYEERAWYGYRSCLSELNSCIHELEKQILRKDQLAAREVLHRMAGTTQIMENAQLIYLVRQLQRLIRFDVAHVEVIPALKELIRVFGDLLHGFQSEEKVRCILIFSEDRAQSAILGNYIDQQVEEDVQIACESKVDNLIFVSDQLLPDILLVIAADGAAPGAVLTQTLENLAAKLPATSVQYFNLSHEFDFHPIKKQLFGLVQFDHTYFEYKTRNVS